MNRQAFDQHAYTKRRLDQHGHTLHNQCVGSLVCKTKINTDEKERILNTQLENIQEDQIDIHDFVDAFLEVDSISCPSRT